MIFHHPLITLGVAWWALVAVTLQLDQGTLIVSLTSVIGPSLAVTLAYRLNKRSQRAIDEKLEKQNIAAALAAQAARAAVNDAEKAASESKSTADETHRLVNSQKDELERKLADRDKRIDRLEGLLASQSQPSS